MRDIIIAAGDLYTEIDVLACAVGYCELLGHQGLSSRVVLPGPFNKSITEKISKWPLEFDKEPGDVSSSNFVIVDISEPDHIAKFVDQENIIKIYDHHYGFEEYWTHKYGDKAKIDRVGACATLIWEEFTLLNSESKISDVSANLLSTAILSNTLNFKASVTTNRDVNAYEKLKKYTNLPDNWEKIYFRDQEEFSLKNPYKAVKEDTIMITTNLPYRLTISQLELWNSNGFIQRNIGEITKALNSFGNDYWFLTSPSISEGKNYIYSKNVQVKKMLSNLLKVSFDGDFASTDTLILRKEIKKMLLDYK